MIVRKIGNVTVYDDFKFSDSMNRVENLRIDLKQTFINQLIFAAKTRLFGPIQARCKSGKNRSKNMDKLNILLGL